MRLLKITLIFTLSSFLFVDSTGWAWQETAEKATDSVQDQDDKAEEEQEEDELVEIEVADGTMKFQAPKAWGTVEPKFSMIEAEFSMKATDEDGEEDDDAPAGRMTLMSSGGGIDGNIQRWYGQFSQADGKSTGDVAEVEEIEVAGHTVHMVDISGDYLGGPGSSGAKLEGYRMLAAIIETGGETNYFVKFYGPAKIVEANAKHFKKFIESMEVEK